MTDFAKMSDQDLELWICNRPGIDPHPDGGWYTSSVDAALTLIANASCDIEAIGGSVYFTLMPDDGERRGGYRFDEVWTMRKPRKQLARAICEAWAQMMEAENE